MALVGKSALSSPKAMAMGATGGSVTTPSCRRMADPNSADGFSSYGAPGGVCSPVAQRRHPQWAERAGSPATVGHLDRRDDDRQGNPGFRERRQNSKIQNVLDEASSPSPPAPEASRHRRRTALL
jgi:hypothetical protein